MTKSEKPQQMNRNTAAGLAVAFWILAVLAGIRVSAALDATGDIPWFTFVAMIGWALSGTMFGHMARR
jgi:hypothetical protein